jgi:hypothetical protein
MLSGYSILVSRGANFEVLRQGEVQHSPTPIGPGPPARKREEEAARYKGERRKERTAPTL